MIRRRRGNSKAATGKTYDVGFGRPPTATRFKPGKSRNPKGRKKGTKSLRTALQDILAQHVTVREGDKIRTMPKSEAMLHKVFAKAMQGDAKAFVVLVNLARECGHFEQEQGDHCIEVVFVKPDGTREPI